MGRSFAIALAVLATVLALPAPAAGHAQDQTATGRTDTPRREQLGFELETRPRVGRECRL